MFVTLLALLITLAAAGLVVAYVAYIQQGKDIPRAPWLTEALKRAAERWSVRTEPAEHRDPERQLHVDHGGIRRGPER